MDAEETDQVNEKMFEVYFYVLICVRGSMNVLQQIQLEQSIHIRLSFMFEVKSPVRIFDILIKLIRF